MNRRAFLRGLLGAAVCAVARFSPLTAVATLVRERPRLTLLEWARRVDPDGAVWKTAAMLSEPNPLLDDLVVTPIPTLGVAFVQADYRKRLDSLPGNVRRQLVAGDFDAE